MLVSYLTFVICVVIPGIYSQTQSTSFLEWFNKSDVDDVPNIPLVHFQRKSYHIQSILKANFHQGLQYCRYYGMQLVSITSKEENDFLEKQIRDLVLCEDSSTDREKPLVPPPTFRGPFGVPPARVGCFKVLALGLTGQHFWTSATRLPDSDHWIWLSTGRQAVYTNWHPEEPNGKKTNEECVEIRIYNKGLTWNDIACKRDFYFICDYSWSKDCYSMLTNMNETSPLLDVRIQPQSV